MEQRTVWQVVTTDHGQFAQRDAVDQHRGVLRCDTEREIPMVEGQEGGWGMFMSLHGDTDPRAVRQSGKLPCSHP
jgi:hypothetical protein